MATRLGFTASGFSAVLLATTALAGQAYAQEQEQDVGAAEARETIVVTAQRREQNIFDVPISITAVTGDELEARNIERLRDLRFAVPGLAVTDNAAGTSRISLRGVSQFVGAPTIGSYIDEVSVAPAGAGGGLSVQLVDLERVEVLRGPQAVLYGESSMGGTIRYITKDPTFEDVNGFAEFQGATITDGGEYYRGEGAVNVPLSDTFALRVSGAYEDAGGWIDSPRGEDTNSSTVGYLRGKALFEPTPNLSVSALGIWQNTEVEDSLLEDENRSNTFAIQGDSADEYLLGNLLVNYDLGFATVTSSTSYLDRDSFLRSDEPSLIFFFNTPTTPVNAVGLVSDSAFERVSQEVRLASNSDGPIRYIIGATYIEDEQSGIATFETAPTSAANIPLVSLFSSDSAFTSDFWTIYGQVDYDLTDRLELSAGGRYFEDKRQRIDNNSGALTGDDTFDSFNPRVALSYRLDDGLIYANAAKGFRSGGFNQPTDDPSSFGPETIWSYEVGAKKQLFDNRLLFDLAVYYNEWEDIQQNAIFNGVPVRVTINGGEASGFGVDFGASLRATDKLTLGGTLGYTSIEYDTASATHNAGDPLDLVPEYNASLSADYRQPLVSGADLYGRVDLGLQDKTQNTLRNFGNQITFTDEQSVLNARFGYETEYYDVYLFGENLTDEDGITFPAVGTTALPARQRPMTIGIGIRVGGG